MADSRLVDFNKVSISRGFPIENPSVMNNKADLSFLSSTESPLSLTTIILEKEIFPSYSGDRRRDMTRSKTLLSEFIEENTIVSMSLSS